MIKTRLIAVVLALVLSLGVVYYAWKYVDSKTSLVIQDFNYEKDHVAVDELFHKGDNFYWMIYDGGVSSTYSVDFMLKYKTPYRHEKVSILVLKVAKVDGKIAGFLAYYPKSAYVWQMLFVLVDQDFRRQGIARKMVKYAMDDMVARGAILINVGTRDNNFKAQSLYTSFGFKFTEADEHSKGFWHYVWHKP